MKDSRFRKLLIVGLVVVLIIVVAGCDNSILTSILPPTPNLTAAHDAWITPSATPTWSPLEPTYLTPAPTITPLIGGGKTITFQDYDQTLILEIGETFVIQRLPDKSYTKVQGPGIIQLVYGPSDPTQGDQEYQAIASGETNLQIGISYPCPTTESVNPGCGLPQLPHFLHIRVPGENTATPTPYLYTAMPYPNPATSYP